MASRYTVDPKTFDIFSCCPNQYDSQEAAIQTHLDKIDRVTISPGRMNGEPCIRDLRLTVRRVASAKV